MMAFDKDFRFGSDSVVSISSVCMDETLAREIRLSDYVRNETLRRCFAIPGYQYKSLEWKNMYYEVIQRKVKVEAGLV